MRRFFAWLRPDKEGLERIRKAQLETSRAVAEEKSMASQNLESASIFRRWQVENGFAQVWEDALGRRKR